MLRKQHFERHGILRHYEWFERLGGIPLDNYNTFGLDEYNTFGFDERSAGGLRAPKPLRVQFQTLLMNCLRARNICFVKRNLRNVFESGTFEMLTKH